MKMDVRGISIGKIFSGKEMHSLFHGNKSKSVILGDFDDCKLLKSKTNQ